MERKSTILTTINQIRTQASSILVTAQTIIKSSHLRSALSYLALSVSVIAAFFAALPVLVVVGGIMVARYLEEE